VSEILTIIKVAVMFLLGLILIFDGYKLEKIIITVLWFLLGFNLATDVLTLVNFSTGLVPFIIEIIVGLCFAAVGFKLDRLAFFVAVAYGMYVAIPSYFTLSNNILFLIVRIILAVVVALIALKFKEIIYALIASLIGATIMKKAVLLLFPTLSSGYITVINIIVIILVIVGILSQIEEYHKS